MAGPVLSARAFVKGCTLVAKYIRVRDSADWEPEDFTLKILGFSKDFPEVNDGQFIYACEEWIQAQGQADFLRFPTWKQLMVPLYRTENGIANRSWGPRPDLPGPVQFTAEQLDQLPAAVQSVEPYPDPIIARAYERLPRPPGHLLLPEAVAPAQEDDPDDTTRLTDAKWQAHLQGFAAGTDPTDSQLPWSKPFATRNVLETGLREGLWSVTDFNGPSPAPPVLPSLGFLEQYPQFRDRHFRDLAAYARRPQRPLF